MDRIELFSWILIIRTFLADSTDFLNWKHNYTVSSNYIFYLIIIVILVVTLFALPWFKNATIDDFDEDKINIALDETLEKIFMTKD